MGRVEDAETCRRQRSEKHDVVPQIARDICVGQRKRVKKVIFLKKNTHTHKKKAVFFLGLFALFNDESALTLRKRVKRKKVGSKQ